MRLFAGLGNPGPEHARDRHNVGFEAVDSIHRVHGFPPWRARFQGLVSDGRLGDERVSLLKPQTFMNESGRSVAEALRWLKLSPEALVVFHDELDLEPLRVKVKRGGGHAGHNGLKSIDRLVGPGYWRVRIGIGHPGDRARVTGYVLSPWDKALRPALDRLLEDLAHLAPLLAAGHTERFMSDVALRQREGAHGP
ncbi:MAG: aminoacyl-tRNA hydrolase [Sphingomonadaceae bacterium]|uniref:aminoacyl-tRNA hydrolase n=1 Tax=Thermaurantiacus sp. TaxID=2820283 RepID=UPI00298F11B6|nr:aminoacyl-tRNA hydrolase [Thermaurantiacus sp.]MCS6987861.1 aminoacyl-tRNA hydrolase [Sphingomonadaceae bacterium]MDW8414919.1 aminoacyl-tRNA hydrolase [Thermaurantiacus sp.]